MSASETTKLAGSLHTPAEVDAAYAFCRSVAHKHGANFSVGFRFLPRRKRRAVYAAYAFCRWADDIADDGGPDVAKRLDGWHEELERCYAGHPQHVISVALADALRFFAIPKSAFAALIAGCRQDITKTRYRNFEELLGYCDLVATSIADISLAIFGYKTDKANVYGRHLATALQLTNVTRDVGDDLERDRIYLPADELARFGVTEDDLMQRRDTAAMRALLEFQIDRAEEYFRKAQPLVSELDFGARFPTLLMGGVYATVLKRLRRDPLVALHRRISLSKAEKLAVIARRLVIPRFV